MYVGNKRITVPVLCLIISLAIGAYLRLHNISQYMTFLGDEGRDVLVVKRMIVDHKFTLLGPTASVGGFFMGPIYYYFMLPFLWLWNLDPVGPAIMVALFGLLTVLLVYLLGQALFDSWVGLMAAVLYSFSPFIIAYSRSSWNPNIVPFFATLLMYSLWRFYESRRMRWLFVSGVCIGIGVQLHYVFLFLIPVATIWTAQICRTKQLLLSGLVAIFGVIVGIAPFLAFEVRHGFPNTISIFRFITSSEDTGLNISHALVVMGDVLYRLFGRLLFRLPDQGVFELMSKNMQVFWRQGIVIIILACILVLMGLIIKRSKEKITIVQAQAAKLLLLWCVLPLICFGFYKKAIYDYYFGIFYPTPFLFLAILLGSIGSRLLGKVFATAALLLLLWYFWQGRPFLFTPNNQLGQVKKISETAMGFTGGMPFNFALITGGNSDHAYRYFFEIWGNAPPVIENYVNDPERKTVTGQLIVICETNECKPLGHPLWEIAGFGRAEIVKETDMQFVKILKLQHYTSDRTL